MGRWVRGYVGRWVGTWVGTWVVWVDAWVDSHLLLLLRQLAVHWPTQRWGASLVLRLLLALVLLALLVRMYGWYRYHRGRGRGRAGSFGRLVGVRPRVLLRPRPLLSMRMRLHPLHFDMLSLQRVRHRLQRVTLGLGAHQHVLGSGGAVLRARELRGRGVELAPKALDHVLLLAGG